MNSLDQKYIDFDELAKKIENRIKELEKNNPRDKNEVKIEFSDKKTQRHLSELDEIINEIDSRIDELEKQSAAKVELNIDDLTDKVNNKLEELEYLEDDELDKTLTDLSNISNAINDAMRDMEAKRKRKKQQKAKYCDLARKRANSYKNKKTK